MEKIDEMVAGYLVGFDKPHDELPICYQAQSPAWKHGWKNGRDDIIGRPSERASVQKSRAAMILA